MPITLFTVGGVDVDPLLEGFEIRETTGNIGTLTCDVESIGSPVQRFSVHQETIVEEDDVRIFAGNNTQTHERGFGGPNLYDAASGAPQIVTTITAENHERLAERVYYTGTIADGTLLKAAMTTVLAGDLGTELGVTLDASQVDGPALPQMVFTRTRVSDVAKAFSDASGYLSRIDYDKNWRMWSPGDIAAPFDIDEDDDPPKWTGDVEVETILGDDYANRVVVTGDPKDETNHIETFVGDGSTSTFDLSWTFVAAYGIIHRYVTSTGAVSGGETFGIKDVDFDGAGNPTQWWYDPATNSITRNAGASESGFTYKLTFHATFQASAEAEDATAIADPDIGLYQYVEQRDDIVDNDAAQALADQLLATKLASGSQTISFQTRYPAPTLRAGQQMSITAPSRNLSGDFIITDITVQAETPATDEFAPTLGLIRTVTATKSNPFANQYQSTYQDWLFGGSGASSSPVSVGDGVPVSVGPGLPNRAVQYNRNGGFGGDEDFIYYESENSIVCGDASSITSADFAECFVFGDNCHISD